MLYKPPGGSIETDEPASERPADERARVHGEHPFLLDAGGGGHIPDIRPNHHLLLLAKKQKDQGGFAYWFCLTLF
jgi:hypothetical protein